MKDPNNVQHPQSRKGWEFTFFGGTPKSYEEQSNAHTAQTSFPLAMANVGDRVWIVKLNGEDGLARRLIDMGLTLGCELQIVSRTSSGSVVVGIQDTRIGLGAGMAHKVLVTAVYQIAQHREDKMNAKLRNLAVGCRGRVVGYEQTARAYREKLLPMGLTPGTEFTVTRHAPLGDPIEIEVRGFHLSLRKDEADALRIEEVQS
ncbi:ferrous iron transport protein A [Gloeocapsopsis crepidinum LEGE 06123]|uniref:Ferrous iron transport protein A n=1 Tax=Gloeocapsopsis crepidinum LEGE 06123 TaxID=588587 RepID=A0ABR9UN35_9CHRO|nr:FeoA family protein [Gloeocapsopsis crepidinum]MBE9189696.1 ferrous iron transport protein A [Gloeocapsopsis crepidinum LEGE 06123]